MAEENNQQAPPPSTLKRTRQAPPDAGEVARMILGAMVAGDPVIGVGQAVLGDGDGNDFMRIVIILGQDNVRRSRNAIEMLKRLYPVATDMFPEDKPAPQPEEPAEDQPDAGIPPRKYLKVGLATAEEPAEDRHQEEESPS